MRRAGLCEILLAGLVGSTTLVVPSPSHAQVASDIAADGTLGTTVIQTGNVFDIDGGTGGGVNLFHSLSRFTVGTGDAANFNGAASVQNIIGRITGGSTSTIDGTVASTIAGANLYLVNPAGILFGPNALINVDGSFHATTADFVRFSDDSAFFVDPASASTLAAAPIARFGFLSSAPGPITIETPTVQDSNSPRVGTPGLQSVPGGTISIVGGNITLGAADGSAPAYLLAPGGNVRLASVASAGEAVLGDGANIDVSRFSALGTVRLQGSSLVDGSHIVIRGAQVQIADATVLPGAFSLFGLAPPPDGGAVDIAATDVLAISGTAPDPVFGAPTGVLVFAGLDPALPFARVPNVTLAARSITLSGPSGVTTNRFLGGPAGIVTLDADTVTVTDGASVSLLNAHAGDGGLLRVTARSVTLDGTGTEAFTGFAAQSVFNPAYLTSAIDPELTFAASGSIEVEATDKLILRGGAEITTDSRSFGPSGDIALVVGDLELDASRVLAQSSFAGDSGDVTIDASRHVSISNGSVISAATLGGGNGGAVRMTAAAGVTIDGVASGIASQTTPLPAAEQNAFAELVLGPGMDFAALLSALGLPPEADMFAVLATLNDLGLTAVPEDQLTPGDGGAIEIVTPTLKLSGLNSAIDSSTAWDGDAGNVSISAATINIGEGATIGSRSGIPDLATGELFVGTGNAGNVNLSATRNVIISGTGATVSTDTRGAGDAGNIAIVAHRLLLSTGGEVSSSSSGAGLAGNIEITLGDSLEVNASSIATEALSSDGGNITITAPRLVELINGRITTSVGSGQGNGGNILIDPDFVVLQSSQIIANAFGGTGGNIDIIAGFLIVSPDSLIDASSALGVDGFVRTTAPDSDVSAGLAVLPASYLDAASKLQAGCGAAQAGQSSLTQIGRGGVPPDPGGYLTSQGMTASVVPISALDSNAMYQRIYQRIYLAGTAEVGALDCAL